MRSRISGVGELVRGASTSLALRASDASSYNTGMRTELRIVAGDLRGRKLHVKVGSYLRPTPQRVREALFSILGDAVPDRLFLDVFAGTGVNGLEALSRGAK